jgi:hypothetical protein
LLERQRVHIRGSDVDAYQENLMLSGLPDLAGISVRH